MHIQNENYADVLALPVVFRDITGVEQLVLGAQAPITQVPFFAETYQYLLDNSISNTVMEINVAENSTNSQLTGLMIPKVISSASYDVPFFIRRTIDGTHKRGSLMIFPQITAASQLGTIEYQNDLCLSSFIKVATETAYNVSMDDAEWTTCYEFWQDDLFTAIAEVAANDSISQLPISLPACISAILTHMKASDCIGNLPALTSEGLKFIASHVMANLVFLNDASGVTPSCPQLQGMQLDPHQTEISNTDRENEFCELAQSVGGSSMLSFGGRANQWCALFGSGIDPNTKYGPGNNEDDIYINPGDIVTYDITFENDSNATASVEILNVLDTLDAGKFVLNSFRWGPIALGDSIYIQPDSEELQQVILHDLRPALPYFLLCELNFDTASAVISWNFATLDTLNLQPLDLVLDGFLPPNGNGNEGSGDLIFFIQLNPELTTGDSIQNKAHIIFDFNAEIVTPYWTNVIDNEPPQSEVLDLPVNIGEETFLISWSGVDNPAGIDSYTIYVSKDDGPFLPWIVMTDTLSSYFIGQYGSTYKFYSNAIDNAGNWELSPEDPWNNYDAITQLVDNIEEIAGSAQFFLYPNPADNAISVHLLLKENAMMRTEWINILGESIQVDGNIDSQVKVSAGSSTRTFDISLLSPGMYFLKLYINEQAASLRFIRK